MHVNTGNHTSSNINQNGVRQRVPLQNGSRGGDTTPTNSNSCLRDTSMTGLPPPPLSTGVSRQGRMSIIDALSHPAQAAAAAAAVGNHPPRGRKRKTLSLVLLTLMSGAVVYYSGTMYQYDDYFADAKPVRRPPRLRSHSPAVTAMGMDYQLSTISRLARQFQPPSPNDEGLSARQIVVRNRIVNALKAAFTADAASMGTHWIYNTNELEVQLQSKEEPEFRSPPVPKFYSSLEFPEHYRSGMASPYGEQLLFVTNYVASMATGATSRRSAEEFDMDDDEDSNVPDSILEPLSAAMQTWATTFGGRSDHAALQFLSCRRDRQVQPFLEGANNNNNNNNLVHQNNDDEDSGEDEVQSLCGANDDQAHFFIKVIPMTCLWLGHPHRRHYVEQAIRVHQNNDNAVLLGLALSDLLERVLLMDDGSPLDDTTTSSIPPMPESKETSNIRPVTSLRDALDTTLTLFQEEHSEGWFHFADSFTARHQQQEALLDSWIKAKKTAQKKKSIAQVAAASGSSCHMPGALIVSLHALYRAANAEAKTPSAGVMEDKKPTSPATHEALGYDYLVKTLLGIGNSSRSPPPREENPLLVAAVRGNILAAGDTCSRAILMGAILGAAYGGPPTAWWEKLYPVLAGQVEESAYTIADHAVRRLRPKRRRRRLSHSQQAQSTRTTTSL